VLNQIYQASDTVFFDLIHTKLELSFNYKLKQVIGKAEIRLKPYIYSTDILKLDAKNFEVIEIGLIGEDQILPLQYTYNQSEIIISLDKAYNRNEEFKIFIDYIAKPNEIAETGSWAIRSNQGLYFVDSDTDNPQIWTQGETQSNSCWFPTIDSPTQNMTQEIYLTVKKEFKSLSNGILVSSLPNPDGTRTDYWKQEKPHAPYLTMIAVGKFEIIEDYWRDLPVFVYVEEKDIPKAKSLYAKTYKMIDMYSRILDFDYPWDKYHQIVVRDFVSGAMENTGAVVFGDYVLHYGNEEQRMEYECVVAHELSHHWFGNLVTCESWANLPLNESFATYMEYIWLEHEYGRTIADIHLEQDYLNYTFERFFKDENLIRFNYKHRDDMFDAHSYQKGGIILHLLRYTVGDDAFWKALQIYLKEYAYQPVEIHHLRLAFEKVTGYDMNWFFDQWFFHKGIPELNISYAYDQQTKKASITIKQMQDIKKFPLYKIPTFVDLYYKDTVFRRPLYIDQQNEVFEFSSPSKPLFMNVDPENAILCKKKENYTLEDYISILEKAPLYKDKNEALNQLINSNDSRLNAVYLKLTKHDYWMFRMEALKRLKINKDDSLYEDYIETLKQLIEKDIHPDIRTMAKVLLSKNI
jgi:aminopeptidase N